VFLPVIDKVAADIGQVTQSEIDAVVSVLDPIFIDPKEMAAFRGYYDIEDQLEKLGINRFWPK
jgi:hypothetical protein